MNSHPHSQYTADIAAKLKDAGVPRIYDYDRCIPRNGQFALVHPGWGDIQLRIRHGSGEIVLWFFTPEKDTVVGIGEVASKYDDPVTGPHPFYQPIPPTAEIQLQPLWQHIGVTYRPATVAEVFQDATKLTAISGICRKPRRVQRDGTFLTVVHGFIWNGWNGFHDAVKKRFDNRYDETKTQFITVSPVPAPVMQMPQIANALQNGKWPLLAIDGEIDGLIALTSNWTLIPW